MLRDTARCFLVGLQLEVIKTTRQIVDNYSGGHLFARNELAVVITGSFWINSTEYGDKYYTLYGV